MIAGPQTWTRWLGPALLAPALLVTALSAPAQENGESAAEAARQKAAGLSAMQRAEKLQELQTPESLDEALEIYRQVHEQFQQLGDSANAAAALEGMGAVDSDGARYAAALESYLQAESLWRSLGEGPGRARCLTEIGLLHNALGENDRALASLERALELSRSLNASDLSAAALAALGSVYYSLGENPRALEILEQALDLYRAAADPFHEAQTLHQIAMVHEVEGDLSQALALYNQAVPLYRERRDRKLLGAVLNNIGVVHLVRGEASAALDKIAEGLELSRAANQPLGEAYGLIRSGQAHLALGHNDQALDDLRRAVSLFEELGEPLGLGLALRNLGTAHAALGDWQPAETFYRRALKVLEEFGDRARQAVVHFDLGSLHMVQGNPGTARDAYEQALELARATGTRVWEAHALSSLGDASRLLGEPDRGMTYLEQAYEIHHQAGMLLGQALDLHRQGRVLADQGRTGEALERYRRSLELSRKLGQRRSEAEVLYSMAQAEASRGGVAVARRHIAAALDLVESLRQTVTGEWLRTAYLSSKQDFYELDVDLLMQLDRVYPGEGYLGQALQAAERALGRSLLEILGEDRSEIRQGAEPQLRRRELELERRLSDREAYRTHLLMTAAEEQDTVEEEIGALVAEYQEVQRRLRATSPAYAALTDPVPLTLEEIQRQVLDSDTVLLEYAPGRERSFLWRVTTSSIHGFELPGQQVLEEAAERFYRLLHARNERPRFETAGDRELRIAAADAAYPEAAAALGELLLGPVAGRLGAERVAIVSPGFLQLVPFAALPVPPSRESGEGAPLLVDHEVVSLPSASVLAVLRREAARRRRAPLTLVVLADPVFARDDTRIARGAGRTDASEAPPGPAAAPGGQTRRSDDVLRSAAESGVLRGGGSIPRLPFTRKEAEDILALVPADQRLKALDFSASRHTATSSELSRYRFVHFATHGFVNPRHPELSGLVLSLFDEQGREQDGFLRLYDVYNLRLRADLVALSACQTALGKQMRGEGLLGLTRGFMYAGAPRVVSSLWSTQDEATAELMARFYRAMLRDGLAPVAALRSAQLSLRREQRWRFPYFWAGFLLQGEWRP